MSPASSGALEVERYIGACLISSQQGRHKVKTVGLNHNHHAAGYVDGRYRVQGCNSGDRWAGGMPLISFGNAQRWRHHDNHNHHHNHNHPRLESHSPLARLAVHTQGAPLILSNRYNHRKNKHQRNSSPKVTDSVNKTKLERDGVGSSSVCGTDAVSVTSDESSGSANSENCLPRIIKPRKRRKKDRKPPPHLVRPISQDGSFSTDSASPDIDSRSPPAFIAFMPYFPFNYDFRYKPVAESSGTKFGGDISETPNLHHSFEDVEDFDAGTDLNGNQTESSCQCRYCDPAGQIWDIDRSCYSPYLTSPGQKPFQYPDASSLLGMGKSYSSPSHSQCLVDNLNSLSLEDDGGGGKSAAPSPRTSRDLEVSTEIVTSLNGHRDLEIKFFSASLDISKYPRDSSAVNADKDDVESYDKSEKNKACSVNMCPSFAGKV